MKKALSFALALILLLTAFPVYAMAAETDTFDHDELIAMACEVFPEYADKITAKPSRSSMDTRSASSEMYVVNQETRQVDENAFLTYAEHNNGIVTLGMARFNTDPQLTIVDSETHSTYEQFTASIYATVQEGSHHFSASNIVYRIYPNSYDQVTSVGSYTLIGPNSSSSQNITARTRRYETATDYAYAGYDFPIIVGTSNRSGTVTLKVQANKATVEYSIK